MNQDTPAEGEPVDMVILTELVEESKLRKAMCALANFDDALGPVDRIRIHPREALN